MTTSVPYTRITNRPISAQNATGTLPEGVVSWDLNGLTGYVNSAPKLQSRYTIELANIAATAGVDDRIALFRSKIGGMFMGLNRCIKSAVVSLNGGKDITTNINTHLDAITQSMSDEQLARISPLSARDTSSVWNSTRIDDPLIDGLDVVRGRDTRGLNSRYESSFADGGTDSKLLFTFTIVSRIMAAPFQFMSENPTPFPELRSFKMDLTIENPINNLLAINQSVGRDGAPGYIQASVVSAEHKLIMETFQPSALMPSPVYPLYYNAPEVHLLSTLPLLSVPAGVGTTPGEAEQDSGQLVENEGAPTFTMFHSEYVNALAADQPGLPVVVASVKSKEAEISGTEGIYRGYTPQQLYTDLTTSGYAERFYTFNQSGKATAYGASGGAGDLTVVGFGSGAVDIVDTATIPITDPAFSTGAEEKFTIRRLATLKNMYTTPQNVRTRVFTIRERALRYDGEKYVLERLLHPKSAVFKAKVAFSGNTAQSNAIRGGNLLGDFGRWLLPMLFRNAGPIVRSVRNTSALKDYVGNDTVPGKLASLIGYGQKAPAKKRKPTVKKSGKGVVRLGGSALSRDEVDELMF